MSRKYETLEPSFTQFFSQSGQSLGFDTSQAVSLFASTSFLYSLGIMLSVVAAGIMYMRAGAIRMQASEQAVRKSNAEIKRVTIGLLGVLSLFVIIYTFNRDLLTGDVGLEALRSGQGSFSGFSASTPAPAPSGTSASCATTQSVISSLTSSQGICGGATCSALTGCNYQAYEGMIVNAANQAGVRPSVVIAIMCKESKAKPAAQNKNPNNTYDCGLMQVNNGTTPCGADILDPATNITRGVALIKQKMQASNQVYQNIPPITSALASYNCCANGTVPSAPSTDCTQASGFPYAIPKWACPINPGDGQFNMCAVKSYVCDLTACIAQLEG